MFDINIMATLLKVIESQEDKNAFCIAKKFYTYGQFAQCISKVRNELQTRAIESKNIGLIENDDLETYASIFALWLEGLAYVPISSDAPIDRNEDVIKQSNISVIIDSSESTKFSSYDLIESSKLTNLKLNLKTTIISEEDLVYILFTSGTTGRPKGVPISRSNLSAFVKSYEDLALNITNEDRCLQMFNLTFDLSVVSYLIPLLKGACVFTIPKNEIKYSYVYELLDEDDISVTMMVPSIIQYLRPYFDEMNFPKMKYSLFCGEALSLKLMEEWSECIPNASIINVYGPTEHTVFCTQYKYDSEKALNYNGSLSIGKQIGNSNLIIIDENGKLVPSGEKGELCLIGDQLMEGYWNNEKKSKEVFLNIEIDGVFHKAYRTGDLCFKDAQGFFFYSGRLDFQTKIQGFRVELSEIECHAKDYLDKINVVALAIENKLGNNEIGLVIESEETDTEDLFNYLKSKMPQYMIPTRLRFEPIFPLNINGKIDRKVLTALFLKNKENE